MARKNILPAILLGCLVYLTEYRGEADYKVYLSDFKGEDMAKGMFKDCKFSKFRGGGEITKVYLTKFAVKRISLCSARNSCAGIDQQAVAILPSRMQTDKVCMQ